MSKRPVHVAIVQQSAIPGDLAGSIDLALGIIDEAASKGAGLIVFGECWLTGYPAWIDHVRDYTQWDDARTKQAFQELHDSSISVDSDDMRRIIAKSGETNTCICIGLNEIDNPSTGTIFNSLLIIDRGTVVNHHRKLMPTYTEKLLYGVGDGSGLRGVDTSVGRVGALICWEHWMPLARQAMHNSVEDIHIALWPQVHELLQVASRHYAFEGRCYVIAVGQISTSDQFPEALKTDSTGEQRIVLNGRSAIIGPDGKYLLQPNEDMSPIIYYTIEDLNARYQEKMTLDVSGHYQRHDVFEFRYRGDSDEPSNRGSA